MSNSNVSVFYEILEAVVNMQMAQLGNEEAMADTTALLANKLYGIYKDANKVLSDDAEAITNYHPKKWDNDAMAQLQQYEAQYNEDAAEYQNYENVWNSATQNSETTVQQLSQEQAQTAQFGSDAVDMGGFAAQLLASAMG